MSDRLVVAGSDPAAWQRAISQVIDIALVNRELLYVFDRNEDTFHGLVANDPEVSGGLERFAAQAEHLFGEKVPDPALRVRLGCTFGAVFGPLVMLARHYQDIPDVRVNVAKSPLTGS